MEKKNTLLLTVISIATLLVAVVGATYAYFASSITISNKIPVNVNTVAGAGIFTAISEGSIHFNVTSAAMLQNGASNSAVAINTSAGESNSASIKANLKSSAAGNSVTCTYDIEWEWASGSSYTPSTGLANDGKELTISLKEGTNVKLAEVNINKLNNNKLVTSETITSSNTTDGVTKTYTATMAFYNLTIRQDADGSASQQEGKNFAGNIKITNVKC